ncbi:MAG: phosphoglucomutase, alpha-D-glucose phosphate-specific, partial [Deltaproteobacteria bacterium]|nr:phosphoglucomutase, alpha-D-glucose phosphate-specific [Deltaproteobacteria bacterium]
RQHQDQLADGLIITPSHNPPQDGGIKYNPPNGGPADVDVTDWIQKRANEIMANPSSLPRLSSQRALKAETTKVENFVKPFVEALGQVVDMEAIKASGLKIGADPLGGSGVRYWGHIAESWGLNLTVVNPRIDPGFTFMPLDSDGAIRMDCSSPYAMANLIKSAGDYDLGIGNDPDFDRHGIVSGGQLMNPNHYLAAAIDYLIKNRPNWPQNYRIGKTLVSSSMIDRVVKGAGRELYETPVGFKWFVSGLADGSLGFGGEESAGASFLRLNGRVWTTDKCGFCMTLLAAEMAAKTGKLPHQLYAGLTEKYGSTEYRRIDSDLNDEKKAILGKLQPQSLSGSPIAGLTVSEAFDKAPSNQASIGGLKVTLSDGSWFAVRPSGTEPKMKLYAESLGGADLLENILEQAPKLIFKD